MFPPMCAAEAPLGVDLYSINGTLAQKQCGSTFAPDVLYRGRLTVLFKAPSAHRSVLLHML